MPSHAIRIKQSSSWLRSRLLMSGTHVIAYASTVNLVFYLYARSPMARDSESLPATRPSVTSHPAASILINSSSFSGLWSSLKSKVDVPYPRIALESPVLAQKISVGVISTTQAVVPTFCGILRSVSSLASPPANSPYEP